MKCYTFKGVFVHGCWGGVWNGSGGCYCKSTKDDDKLEKLSRDFEKFKAKMEAKEKKAETGGGE